MVRKPRLEQKNSFLVKKSVLTVLYYCIKKNNSINGQQHKQKQYLISATGKNRKFEP